MKNTVFLLYIFTLGVFSQQNLSEMGSLPMGVYETSGLIFFNEKLITHNDSGNTAQLFEVDTLSMSITRTITISNAENIDWEDIAQDVNYIYVGDFGNNNGDRQNLVIYRIPKIDYISSDNVIADKIEFSYEDQTDFSTSQDSDWDAEALIVYNNELIVFTKQWQSKNTTAYSISTEPGVHVAKKIESYTINGLVTGATVDVAANKLFLIGYSQTLLPFIAISNNINSGALFNTIEKINLNVGLAQVEAIAQVEENHFIISSEKFVNSNPSITLDAKLYSLQITNEIDIPFEEEEENEEMVVEEPLILYKTNGVNVLYYQLNTEDEIYGQAIFNSLGQRISHEQSGNILLSPIDISNFEAAIYYLTFYLQSGVISKPFIKN